MAHHWRLCPLEDELFAFRIDWHNSLSFVDDNGLDGIVPKRNVYVGHVNQMFGLYDTFREFHNVSVYLISRGLPPDLDNGKFGARNHAVAITPNPDVVNGRTPISLEQPLPWNDAYYWTFSSGSVIQYARILPKELEQTHLNLLDVDDEWTLNDYVDEDEGRARCPLPQNDYAENVVRMTHTENEEVVEYTGDARIDFEEEEDVASEVDQPPVEPWTEADDACSLSQGQDVMDFIEANHYKMSEQHPYSPVLELVTYNLSEVEDFANPQDFFKELEELNRLRAAHQEKLTRLAREAVEATRKQMNACPRDVFDTPARCKSTPPVSVVHSPAPVPPHRLRAWFHSRGQNHTGDDDSKKIQCVEDEERFRAFITRVDLPLDKYDTESPVGIDDGRIQTDLPERARSVPPGEISATHPPPSLRTLRIWYHLGHGHAFAADGHMHPPVKEAEDTTFVRLALKLGLDISDLEDMDLPITLDQGKAEVFHGNQRPVQQAGNAEEGWDKVKMSKSPSLSPAETSVAAPPAAEEPTTQHPRTTEPSNTTPHGVKRLMKRLQRWLCLSL